MEVHEIFSPSLQQQNLVQIKLYKQHRLQIQTSWPNDYEVDNIPWNYYIPLSLSTEHPSC